MNTFLSSSVNIVKSIPIQTLASNFTLHRAVVVVESINELRGVSRRTKLAMGIHTTHKACTFLLQDPAHDVY